MLHLRKCTAVQLAVSLASVLIRPPCIKWIYKNAEYLVQLMQYAYIFSTDNSALARCRVVGTRVLIHTPITCPLRSYAVHTRCMPSTVVVCEVAAHEVLIGFWRSHRKWDKHVVPRFRNSWTSGHSRGRTRQPNRSHNSINRLCLPKHAFVFCSGRQFGKSADCQLHLQKTRILISGAYLLHWATWHVYPPAISSVPSLGYRCYYRWLRCFSLSTLVTTSINMRSFEGSFCLGWREVTSKRIPVFRETENPELPQSECPNEDTTLRQHAGIGLLRDLASYLRRTLSSTTQLRKPNNSHSLFCLHISMST